MARSYVARMGSPFSYRVSFQIRHPTARAEAVSIGLPWKRSNGWTVGEERVTPAGTRLTGTRRDTYCNFIVGEGDDGELASCLAEAVDALMPHKGHLAELHRTGGVLSFYVFWYPNGDTGETFKTELLQKLASLNIDLGLNVYDDRPQHD
jgi:hypothetical protein